MEVRTTTTVKKEMNWPFSVLPLGANADPEMLVKLELLHDFNGVS